MPYVICVVIISGAACGCISVGASGSGGGGEHVVLYWLWMVV